MVKPVDITKTVIVPKPHNKQDNLKSFFIGHVDQYIEEETILVAIVSEYYRCTHCGADTKQYINGSIKYLKLEESDKEWLRKQKDSTQR